MFYLIISTKMTTTPGYCYRMKEQLIRELVKNGKDAEAINKQYSEKVSNLEKVRHGVLSATCSCI